MVVFTCNHCGESLQKPKVEKHYATMCRRPKFVSCVDCFKDFRNEEYVSHTKCVTEAQRYAAKGSDVKNQVKKGEVKQESWMEMINSIMSVETNLSNSQQSLLQFLSQQSNCPRKKARFINFVINAFSKKTSQHDINAIWDLIQKFKSTQEANQNGTHDEQLENNTSDQMEMKKSKKTAGKGSAVDDATKLTNEERDVNEDAKMKGSESPKVSRKRKQRENGDAEEAQCNNNQNGTISAKKEKKQTVSDEAGKTKKHSKKAEETENEVSMFDDEILTPTLFSNKKSEVKKKKDTKNEENFEKRGKGTRKEDNVIPSTDRESEKFAFGKKILEVLQSKPAMSLKKLQKKVLNAYVRETGTIGVTDELQKKFEKKLKKLKQIEVKDGNVILVS